MKNVINYYYNLTPSEIHQVGSIYRFQIQNDYYIFEPYTLPQDIQEIYRLSTQLLQVGVYTHQMILNKENQLLTLVNNEPYLLMKYYPLVEEPVKIEDLVTFHVLTKNFAESETSVVSWDHLWSEKIDYFEYQVNQFGKRFPKIRESFSFYVGVAETGISLAQQLPKIKKTVVHRRIRSDSNYFDLYNPLNLTFDVTIRDSCEFFKDRFLQTDKVYEEIINYFQNSYLTTDEYFSFFVRFFYPSFYFDRFERIMRGEAETLLDLVLEKSDDYIVLLKKIYYFLNQYLQLPQIEWLKKEP